MRGNGKNDPCIKPGKTWTGFAAGMYFVCSNMKLIAKAASLDALENQIKEKYKGDEQEKYLITIDIYRRDHPTKVVVA
ncbi:MAG TPA: hypothetical protein VFI61_02875 [Patescibacteria group bacterium]|nr:hypothetical protein [Patescibacteria group bacterium]